MNRFMQAVVVLVVAMLAVTACGSNDANPLDETPSKLEGPALVLFYTDN